MELNPELVAFGDTEQEPMQAHMLLLFNPKF